MKYFPDPEKLVDEPLLVAQENHYAVYEFEDHLKVFVDLDWLPTPDGLLEIAEIGTANGYQFLCVEDDDTWSLSDSHQGIYDEGYEDDE